MEKDTKFNRHILSLPLRAQAIREYNSTEQKITIKALAIKYNVSFRQMHGIISNRYHILKTYEDEFDVKRQQKIEFLGKVMYEYIQRAMQQNVTLNDEIILQKAKEIAQCMSVLNFEITASWLKDFKETYAIPSFDLKSLRENLIFMESKRGELTACELIAYVGSIDAKSQSKNLWCGKRAPSVALASKAATIACSSRNTTPKGNKNNSIVMSETLTTDSEFEHKPLTIMDMETRTTVASNYGDSSLCDEIKSVDGALRHLRLLEEFAMLQENYRAIGLLTQLEGVFKETDFWLTQLWKGGLNTVTEKSSLTAVTEYYSFQKQYNTLLEILAEHKLLLDHIISQNAVVTNIMSIFPIKTVEKLKELDSLLVTQSDLYIRQIKSLLGGNAERNLHQIFGRDIIMTFNVDGSFGKYRLRDFI